MSVRNITLLKSWFRKGAYPLASQFEDWMDSYWHKEEPIPAASVEELPELLNAKFDAAAGAALETGVGRIAAELAAHRTESAAELASLRADIDDLETADGQFASALAELDGRKLDADAVRRIAGPMTAEEYAALTPDDATLYIITD